ncbi:MAG: S-layer homology domain-containing protein, partial [Ruminococcaceae bacterium]|nr:S-layer homology domain-containing protein [Oscillospiraceae bacterium]
MKTTKCLKLISLLLAVFCLVGVLPIQFVSAEAGLTDQQKALLSIVGVYDETKSLDAQLTKGEFVELLSNAVFFEGEEISGYVPQKKITDVDEFSPYYEKVSAMYALGYIPLDTFGRFLPDEPITFGDAVSIMYRALGYTEKQVTTKWKSPERFASAKKLTNGVAMNATSGLSVYNAYVLIYNMLNCNITELFDSNEAVIYMSNKHHLYPISGIVTHDGVVSKDYTTDIRPDQAIIDGVVYLNESGQHDLFGQRISGYYRYGLQDAEKVLVSVYSNNRTNTVTTLHPGDIISFTGRTYRYDLGGLNSKIRNAYIPKEALIIYNEKKLTLDDPFTDDMFIPKNGRVRLYDNNGDGRTDIVRIENFSAGIVGNTDADKEKIYINNSRIITLKGKDYVIEDKYGNELALEEVSKNNVVSFCESFDQTVVKVVVSKEYHTDLVVEYENEGNGIVKTESGGRYVLSEYAAANSEKPEVGGSYNFYFDAFDMLAGIVRDSESNTMAYGVIAAVAQEGTLSPETIVRMFTGAGEFVDFTCNKKVKILGQDDVITYVDQEDLYTTLTYTGGVRYKVNDDGKLTYIELPLAFGQVPDYDDRLY